MEESKIYNPYTQISETKENNSENVILDEANKKEIASDLTIVLMLTKSALGLGMFIQPQMCKYNGYIGFPLIYFGSCAIAVFLISLLFIAADKIEYYGRR